MTKLRILLLVLAIFAGDRLAKLSVEARLELGRPLSVIGDTLRLTHVRNEGVVFGLWSRGNRWLLATLSGAVLGVLFLYFWTTPVTRRLLLVSLGFVMGGAAGNLYDRVVRGFVTDYVDVDLVFMRWPAFNVADACICIGVGLMALDVMRGKRERQPLGQ